MTTKLKIDGTMYEVTVDENTPLLWVLREHLNLTGTKYGCGVAQCGACTVLVGGKAVSSERFPNSDCCECFPSGTAKYCDNLVRLGKSGKNCTRPGGPRVW
jgi:xanthine dehydrogenase iron-sulfur cluster and FAD-binding subunit A